MDLRTYQQGLEWLTAHHLPTPTREEILSVYPNHFSAAIPPDSGRKTYLGKAIVDTFFADSTVYLSVGQGIWTSCENVGMFLRMRESSKCAIAGSLDEYPVHILYPKEQNDLEYLLTLCLYFIWDVTVMASDKEMCLVLSHDEFVDIYTRFPLDDTVTTFLKEIFL